MLIDLGGSWEPEGDGREGEIAKEEDAGEILYTDEAGVIKYWLQSEGAGICWDDEQRRGA